MIGQMCRVAEDLSYQDMPRIGCLGLSVPISLRRKAGERCPDTDTQDAL